MRTLAGQPILPLLKGNILVAAHRGIVGTLRTRPVSLGWPGALEAFYLYIVNFMLCPEVRAQPPPRLALLRMDVEVPPFDLQSRTIVLL